MKKVLMVSCNGLGNGGVQNVFMNIVKNCSAKYHFDVLLFTNQRRHYDDEFEQYGDIYRIPHKASKVDFYLRFFRILYGTYRLLKKNRYDAIHCHNNYESGICLLAAKLAGVKVRISHAHMICENNAGNVIGRTYEKFYRFLICKFGTHWVGCSEKAAESLFGKKTDFRVIVNPLDLRRFDSVEKHIKKHDGVRFIHVGVFTDTKNQLFLLEVFSKIKRIRQDVALTLIGFVHEQEYYEQILEVIKKYDLEEDVQILPSDSDIPICLAESDYMIFPSKHEGLGIALLEAQASGVRCFVSSSVPEEANAGLCEFYDLELGSDAWAENIIRFIEQDNGTEKANMEPYDIKNICKKYDEIYSLGGSSK